MLPRPMSLAALLSGMLALAACPGELESPERFLTVATTTGGPTCVDVESDLFPNRCGTAGCHNPTDQAANLDLVSSGVSARLVGVAGSADCNDALLVDPADVEGSLLLTKLDRAPPCGLTMPLVGAPLDDVEIECVRTYLEGIVADATTTGGGMGGGTGGAANGGMGGTGAGGAGGA